MAAAAVQSPTFAYKNLSESNKDSVRLHRYTVAAGNGDTYDTGLGSNVGILEVLVTGVGGAAGASANMAVSSVSAGVITFSAASPSAFDVIVVTSL